MTKSSRIAFVVFASASLLSIACGDDDDPGNSTGGKTGSGGASHPTGGSTAARGGTGNGGVAGGGTAGKGSTAGAGAGGWGGAGGQAGLGGEGGEGGSEWGGAGGTGGGGAGGEAGAGQPPLTGKRHLYVGCADSSGTLQSYLVDGGTLSPLSTVVTGGAISNSTFNAAGDRMHVAHTISGGVTRITTYSRDVTTGALSVLGTPVNVPFTTGAGAGGTGGVGGAGSGGAVSAGGGGGVGGAAGGVGGGATGGAANTAPGPQTLVLDGGEKYVAVPNYFAGNVYTYDVLTNGSLGTLVSSDAGGTNAHDAVFSKNNNFMIVPYLGSNYIKTYTFNGSTGAIALHAQTAMPVAQSGPRHLALHSNGSWLYSINETAGGQSSAAGSLDLFSFNQTTGALTPVQTYAVPLPAGYTGPKNGSEIVIAPSGSFLYVSMRLDNTATGSIVAYAIGAGGALTLVDQYSSHGVTPRQFSLSSDGKLLIVGNQNSNSVALFSVNTTTGKLAYVSERDVCASPRFSRFAEIK